MEAYTAFASVYDRLMEQVDYDQWVAYLEKLWQRYQVHPQLIAELGCGTGNVSGRLAQKGLEVIGIDLSDEMLSVAREKAVAQELDILYLCQDMCGFELYGTVDMILSLCDSMNYITEEKDLLSVFQLANNYLNPKGLFIFDINTEYKFEHVLGETTFGEVEEDMAYIWQNYYDAEEKIHEYEVNFFFRGADKKYTRVEECHYERAYSLEEITALIQQSGLVLVDMFDAFTFEPPKKDSERVYFVTRENGK